MGHNPLTGDYVGPLAVLGFIQKLVEGTNGTFSVEVFDITASDSHVVALVAEHGERNGSSTPLNFAHIWTLSDGKATSFTAWPEDQSAVDAFWT